MKTLFQPADLEEILRRIEALPASAERKWGRMDAAQMLAHCALTMEAATGELRVERRLLAKVLGPLFRGRILGPKPFGRDAPTNPAFVVADARDFAREKSRLLAVVRKFAASGPAAGATREHAFLGRISGEEWGRLMRKHLDHHLTQFGG